MAVSVLERPTQQILYIPTKNVQDDLDREHNAHISENYNRLIHPDEQVKKQETTAAQVPVETAAPVKPLAPIAQEAEAFYDEGTFARHLTSEYLFNAPIAKTAANAASQEQAMAQDMQAPIIDKAEDEEDDEDLKPTKETLSYLNKATTAPVTAKTSEKLVNKKERIVFASFISLVVCLIVLVIVNAAIISSLNKNLSSVESEASATYERYTQVSQSLDKALSDEAIYEYAQENGMILR